MKIGYGKLFATQTRATSRLLSTATKGPKPAIPKPPKTLPVAGVERIILVASGNFFFVVLLQGCLPYTRSGNCGETGT